ncbi:uncharacterized protein BDZ99DRAFT_494049 [Mytilinidion resinicola]|uniref:Vacuolar membrane-associated protein IML1 n=1 Tax=Mytilinidion resinicola TaxID=574789 RepID=A0A6A6Z521_9PEZI|nr:uncharacterized protein BDZ99DRAFT_494049 [Mytilinidion resinicola]KAF2816176.1 hypothetical protein BDZ99DRAFT_494049 [Mytilinidion resinicola]
MSKSTENIKPRRVQKVCTLWTHDENFSKNEVVFNAEKFPELSITQGSLARIIALKQSTAVRDFQSIKNASSEHTRRAETRESAVSSTDMRHIKGDETSREVATDTQTKRPRRHSVTLTLDENGSQFPSSREMDLEKSYVFVIKPMSAEQKAKYPNLQVSISETIAKVFDFRNRMQIIITTADEDTHSASHVEIGFKDEYLARADMWRMAISELSHKTVYKGQKLLFMGTIKATVKNVFINGQSTHSGYFSSVTKPIFRSESARYVLFIQMSKEMWDFDTEGAGEIMFNKVVNGFLPELFKRWMKINARHLVTIILFSRLEYENEEILSGSHPPKRPRPIDKNSQGRPYQDYYRVVVNEMASGDWINILYELKKEFKAFLRDVSLLQKYDSTESDPKREKASDKDAKKNYIIAGAPSMATNGNILEAISLASVQFAKDYIDRDLVRTGISVVVISAGTGIFEVDYNMLKLTTDTLIGTGIGIDLVCLSPIPLHSVPLFKYRNPKIKSSGAPKTMTRFSNRGSPEDDPYQDGDDKTPKQNRPSFGHLFNPSPEKTAHLRSPMRLQMANEPVTDEWSYAMPHWIDVSFWSGPSEEIVELSPPKRTKGSLTRLRNNGRKFNLRCRMYELQMMGIMESELSNISIPFMEEELLFPYALRGFSDKATEMHNGFTDTPIVFPSSASTAGQNSVDHNHAESSLKEGRNIQSTWMKTYDENLFRSLPEKRAAEERILKTGQDWAQPHNGDSHHSLPKDSLLSASFNESIASLGSSARPPPETNFHQLMKERSNTSESPLRRQSQSRGGGFRPSDLSYRHEAFDSYRSIRRPASLKGDGDMPPKSEYAETENAVRTQPRVTVSSPQNARLSTKDATYIKSPLPHTPQAQLSKPQTSPANSTKSKSDANPRQAGWLSRQISFGGLGFGASKSVASATVSSGTVEATRMTVENNQKGAIAAKLASTRTQEIESPSQPIAIKAASRPNAILTHSPSEQASRSVETINGTKAGGGNIQPQSLTKDPNSLFLIAAGSKEASRKPTLSSSGGAQNIPRTLSPTSALSPWLVLVNPCNPKKNNMNLANQFRRWQHVFPKPLRASAIKWKSLCSPAAVPLTNEYFPTAEQLRTEYSENPYKITQNEDDEMSEAPKSRESLIRELIAFRLSHGFQIVVGRAVAEVAGGREHDIAGIFDPKYMSHDGDTVFMCVGSTIHQLVCVAGGEVEIKRFSRKPTTALETSAGVDSPLLYQPLVRTALEKEYAARRIILKPPRREYNWNYIDTFLAGYHEEFSDSLRFWRARFVLIPVELPSVGRRPLPLLSEDSEEEVRLEGIRKLTQIWQRFRYTPPEEGHFQASNKKRKDPNPLAIEYRTGDPSVIVSAGPESSLLVDGDAADVPTQLFSENEQYSTSNIDAKRLAEDLQGEKGIPIVDRRWHFRLHYHCFIGFDFVSWILQNFKDIETRDEAVELGNQLMKKGLFQHVQKKHQFRDGNFFYQIAQEYRAPRPDSRTGWFGTRRSDRSVPSTPLSEPPKSSSMSSRTSRSRPSTADSTGSAEGEKTPTRAGTPKRSVFLSRVMRYDVDPRRRSYRPEIINLHYDRLHNPDNCYHIRIDWMNVTAKLIEDSVSTWVTSIEKYGLKLVEVPIAEASSIRDAHPFRSPYTIRLAKEPPKSQPEQYFDTTQFAPQLKIDKHVYHKALLRKLGFVLDIEAASAFPSDVDVNYSWGKPDYQYTQFIHKSGCLLAQINDKGEFVLLANRLYNNRAAASRDASRFKPTDPYERRPGTTSTSGSTPSERHTASHRSPLSSPLARPVQDSSLLHALAEKPAQAVIQTPEEIKDEIERFCFDSIALTQFYEAYDEAVRSRVPVSPSPHLAPIPDGIIPTIGLAPSITVREASPAPNLGAALMGSQFSSGSYGGSSRSSGRGSDDSGGGRGSST